MFTEKPINLRAPLDHVDESTIIVLAEKFTIWIAPELHLVESLKSEIRSVSKFVVYHLKVSLSEWQRFLVSQDLRNNQCLSPYIIKSEKFIRSLGHVFTKVRDNTIVCPILA